jgi:hypothetical protein
MSTPLRPIIPLQLKFDEYWAGAMSIPHNYRNTNQRRQVYWVPEAGCFDSAIAIWQIVVDDNPIEDNLEAPPTRDNNGLVASMAGLEFSIPYDTPIIPQTIISEVL